MSVQKGVDQHGEGMIDVNSLTPSYTYWFLILFTLTGFTTAVMGVWFVMALREGRDRLKSGMFLAASALAAGAIALPTFLHEIPNNLEAEAAAAGAARDAGATITSAIQDRYEVEAVSPTGESGKSCLLLVCTTPEKGWADVAQEATEGTTPTEPNVAVVLGNGQVAEYGLLYDNETGEATLLQLTGRSPIPGDLMEDG